MAATLPRKSRRLPSMSVVGAKDESQLMKADIRCFVYQRQPCKCSLPVLYQGQTTNFRTPGGGFAPVFVA
jgi:hypothetical protein